jgi:hypothetical protein
MTEIVEAVKESQWMKDGVEATTYWVTLVDGVGQREVPCYDPRGKDLKEDAPLPEGWEVKTSKAGKLYLAAPRAGGGSNRSGGAKRDYVPDWGKTEDGWLKSDERVDRRRALEQAPRDLNGYVNLEMAERIYTWLRESVSAPNSARGEPETGSVASPIKHGADTPSDEGGEQSNSPTHREAASPSSSPSMESLNAIAALTCQHEWVDAPRKGWKLCSKCRRAVPEGETK